MNWKLSRVPRRVLNVLATVVGVGLLITWAFALGIMLQEKNNEDSEVRLSEAPSLEADPCPTLEATISIPETEKITFLFGDSGVTEIRSVRRLGDRISVTSNSITSLGFSLPNILSYFPSPDGRYAAVNVAVAPYRSVLLVDHVKGTQVLTDDNPASAMAWTSDSKVIIVGRTSSDLGAFLVSPSGKEYDKLDFIPRHTYDLSLSSDGQRIAFLYTSSTKGAELWTVNLDGHGMRKLFADDTFRLLSVRWSPDGTRLAFIRLKAYQDIGFPNGEIWVINADGSGLKRLSIENGHDALLSWSPDSEKIAFVRIENPDDEGFLLDWSKMVSNIWTVRVSDGSQKQVAFSEGKRHRSPVWSPNGMWLVFVSNQSGNDEIWLVDANGCQLHQLTRSNEDGQMNFLVWK